MRHKRISKSEAVKRWREHTKKRIVAAMGGSCVCCGYHTCDEALACHHLEKKEMSMGALRANIRAWRVIVKELRKCVLVCHNCHTELHHSTRKLPKDVRRFDERYVDYKRVERGFKQSPCVVCGKPKAITAITCSRACAAKRSWAISWDKVDLRTELQKSSTCQVATKLGVSDTAVRKRARKLGIV